MFSIMLPPPVTSDITSGDAGVDCSVILILDMSMTITPDFGRTGVELPAAASDDTNPIPRIKQMMPAMKRPHITARTILKNCFMF